MKRSNKVIIVDLRKEIRCPQCHRLFAKGQFGSGTTIEIKCRGCKSLINFKAM